MDPFFVRNALYGLEDSLISTTGVVVGMSYANVPTPYILTSGIVLVVVEALSMAYGAYIAEQGFFATTVGARSIMEVVPYGITMFVSYVAAGSLVLAPFVIRVRNPHYYSLAISIGLLFALVVYIENDLMKGLVLTSVGALILAVSIVLGEQLDHQKSSLKAQ